MKNLVANIKTGVAKVQTKAMMKMAGCKTEGGDHLLEVLGTIIIAVVVLIYFRDAIVNIFKSGITTTETQVNNLFTPAS